MKILLTAGNTQALIDKVRCITNIFTGRTGARIALEAYSRGHDVTLLTSHPETVPLSEEQPTSAKWQVHPYKTFEDLRTLMADQIGAERFDAIIHCAAVSDYLSAGVFGLQEGTRFDPAAGNWSGTPPTLIDRVAGKVKSDEPELWIRMVRAPKLVDLIRPLWKFTGVLVKFKLEVGLSDEQLLTVAEHARAHSQADFVVANTLEGAAEYAFIGAGDAGFERVTRADLAGELLDAVEARVASHDRRRGPMQ